MGDGAAVGSLQNNRVHPDQSPAGSLVGGWVPIQFILADSGISVICAVLF